MSRVGKKYRKKKDAARQASAGVLTSALSTALNILVPPKDKPKAKSVLFDKTKPHVPTAFLWQMLHRERMAIWLMWRGV